MSQAKATRDALDQANTEYKQCTHLINRCLDTIPVNERALKVKIQALTDSLAKLNISHTAWVSKAALTSEALAADAFSQEWLQGEWDKVDDIQLRVDDILLKDEPESVIRSASVDLDIFNKQMTTLKQVITSKIKNLLTETAPPSSGDVSINQMSFNLFRDRLNLVTSSLSNEFTVLTEKILSTDHKNAATLCTDFEMFRRVQQKHIDTINSQLAARTTSTNCETTNVLKGMDMEKSKAPSFSGKTLDYPEFKRGWQKTAGVCWTDENQVQQIKFKVNSATKRIISRFGTMNEIWSALDAEYAQEEDVINAVNVELKDLRKSSCSVPEYIVMLKNYLPNLEQALKAVGGIEHLHSPERVNYLCTKFDSRTLHDWDYFRGKATGNTYERFYLFLTDQYDATKSSIARTNKTVLDDDDDEEFSRNSDQVVNHLDVSTDCHRCRTFTARNGLYKCPGCGRGTPSGSNIHHCLEHCAAYMEMSPNERSTCVESSNWCPIHLLSTHSLADCTRTNDQRVVCGVNGCDKHHHKSLHGSTSTFVANIHTTFADDDDASNVLLSVQSIATSGDQNIVSMFDNGATCCLISKSAASRLNLQGKDTNLLIRTVTGLKVLPSFSYSVPLYDKNNRDYEIRAYEIESISNDISPNDLSGVKHLFSKKVQQKWKSIENRPAGAIELLIGTNVLGLHPRDHECKGNLKVMSSLFGSGFLLTGSHHAIKSSNITWNEDVSTIRHSVVTSSAHTVNRVSVVPNYNYFDHDNLGIQPPKRCSKCQGCKDCSFRAHKLSLQEQYEQQVLESKVQYDPTQQCFSVSYPFTEDPSILPNNKSQVIKIAEREERKLEKEGRLEEFNQEFDKMIEFGALKEISKEDLDMWEGPTHYVSLQHVINEESATTPLRIVTNSSLSDRNGISVNSITMKGATSMSDHWSVLSQWRAYPISLCSDVTKAYYSLRTGEVEMHIRRVVWRHGQKQSQWKIFGFCTVSFGDRPAAAFLEIAIRRTAEMNENIDPVAAYRIVNDRYVDDFATGGTPEEVSRFVGNESDDFNCDGTFPTILSKGSLRLKVLVASGETNPLKLHKLGSKVLGLGYSPPSDTIIINMNISLNINKGKDKLKLTPENVNSIPSELVTPRNMLSVVNSIYDPLGLVMPVSTRLRVAFRDLFKIENPIQ